jgi:multiple sugar transport system permease protein
MQMKRDSIPRRGSSRAQWWHAKGAGYVFIFPGLIFLLSFVIFPIVYNIVISFQKADLQTLNGFKPFIGLANYVSVFSTSVFYTAVFNTIFFTVICIFFQFVIGMALALLFTRQFAINHFARGILLVGWLVPVLIAAEVWRWIFAGDSSGVLNFLLGKIHLLKQPISYMTTGRGAMLALIVTNTWRGIPFNMVLLFTALTTLPQELLEAASMDGATRLQRFAHITLPWIRPSIITVVTLGFVYTFKTFDLVFIMTGGGPVNATENLATVSYRLAFTNTDFGQGAAVANVMLVILLAVGILNLSLFRRDEVMT